MVHPVTVMDTHWVAVEAVSVVQDQDMAVITSTRVAITICHQVATALTTVEAIPVVMVAAV